jgi:hypothetical protein
VHGNYAYLAAAGNGLVVVDVSDPTNPVLSSTMDDDYAYDVAVAGGYVYVAAGGGGLVVVNVSDPTNPARAGGYDTSGSARGVTVSGDYGYVTGGTEGLVVFDASDPTDLRWADNYGILHRSGSAESVVVSGGYAYLVDKVGFFVLGPDGDGDDMADVNDVFPQDPDEWADTDGDGVGDNADPLPSNPILKAWWQVLMLLALVASGALAARYGHGQYTLARRVSGKVDELRAKIAEFKEKGINTDELERVLVECEAEMGAGNEE